MLNICSFTHKIDCLEEDNQADGILRKNCLGVLSVWRTAYCSNAGSFMSRPHVRPTWYMFLCTKYNYLRTVLCAFGISVLLVPIPLSLWNTAQVVF